MKALRTVSLTVFLAAATACSSFAGTVSYNSPTLGPGLRLSQLTSLGFQQFDPSLGTLTGVDFNLTANVTGLITVESQDPTANAIAVVLEMDLALLLPGGICSSNCTIATASPSKSFTDTLLANGTNTYDTSVDSTFQGSTSADSGNLNAQSILDFFTGTGTADLVLSATANTGVSGSGNQLVTARTRGGAYGSVTYTYTESASTPEPASLFLFGGALVGLGLARRTRLFSK